MNEPVMECEILLAEDNPNDVELALHEFSKIGIADRVHVVRDGVEALHFLFREEEYSGRGSERLPKLLLLDLKLPRMDGLEVVRRIKRDPRTLWLPVVILTTSNEASDISAAWKLGVNSYVIKSVDYDEFSKSLHMIVTYWLTINTLPLIRRTL